MPITYFLKVLLGRQLTQKQLNEIHASEDVGHSIIFPVRIGRYNKKGIMDMEDCPVIVKENYISMVTPDISYGWHNPHEDIYLRRSKTFYYTTDGKLREKVIYDNPNGTGEWATVKAYEYNPPGRFWGKIK